MREFCRLKNGVVDSTLSSLHPPGHDLENIPPDHREVTGLDPLPGIGWRWDPAGESWSPPAPVAADPQRVRREELLARDPAGVSLPELVELLQLLFR